MFSTLPDLIDPWRAADSRTVFAGRLPLASLPRLRGLLLDTAGDASFSLAFYQDTEGRAVVGGEVEACVSLCCQRCMQALEHRIEARMELAFVTGIDEGDRLPDRYDPLLVTNHLIRPRDLIEDELLLGLPQIPRHETGTCSMLVQALPSPAPERPADPGHPFAVLSALKRERNHSLQETRETKHGGPAEPEDPF